MNGPGQFQFRLYIAGNAPNSAQAVANLWALCREHLPERHAVEIVDVLSEPERALADMVLMTPLLLKLSPAPICKIVGSLNHRPSVLQALGLTPNRMSNFPVGAVEDFQDEVAALVERLHETQRRLQELAGGELDAVTDSAGHSYLLHHAQEKLRQSEAAQHNQAALQSSILNALPTNIALIDREGVILSVNESWEHFAESNGLRNFNAGIGQNYLEVCEQSHGNGPETGNPQSHF